MKNKILFSLFLAVFASIYLSGCMEKQPPITATIPYCAVFDCPSEGSIPIVSVIPSPVQSESFTLVTSFPFGNKTKFSNCTVVDALQDKACSPTAVYNVTAKEICVSGYSSSVRDVPKSVWNSVFEEYGVTEHNGTTYEIDHIISLQLGGSNDVANLYAEYVNPQPCPFNLTICGFHEKDKFENFLHRQVCNGNMTLQEAQRQIATNWVKYWVEAGKPRG